MIGNPALWAVIAAIVVGTLFVKGYFRLPTLGGALIPPNATPSAGAHPPLTSHQLGVLFAQAKRREAEEELAALFAKKAGDDLKASFTAPFSPPAPAGQDQSPAGGQSTP